MPYRSLWILGLVGSSLTNPPAFAQEPLITPDGEARQLVELIELVDEAEALGQAAAFSQHAVESPSAACDSEDARAAVRARGFLEAWTAATGRARSRADALSGQAEMPTLAPLRSRQRTESIAATLDRVKRTEAALSGARVAFERSIARLALRCPSELASHPGRPAPGVRALDDPEPLSAIWVSRPGFLCRVEEPRARFVEPGPAFTAGSLCWSDSDACGCEPTPVAPGAVL